MSQIADQRLFELVQLVQVSGPAENESRQRLATRSSSRAPSCSPSRQIVSFAASPCGRLVVFAATASAETAECHGCGVGGVIGGNGSCGVQLADSRPFIGAALLSRLCIEPAASTTRTTDCDANEESVSAGLTWLPWFQDTKYRPRCVTLSPDTNLCLIGCDNGSLFVVWTKFLCPAFEGQTVASKSSGCKEWYNKRANKVFPIGSSAMTKAATVRSDRASSVTWWSPQDHHDSHRAIVGTQTGWLVLIDLHTGNEIGFTHLTNFKITNLEQLTDEASDCTYLFITNEKGKQWRLLLEQRSRSYLWCGRNCNLVTSVSSSDLGSSAFSSAAKPVANGASDAAKKAKSSTTSSASTPSGGAEEISTRSRLAGLKQMSVASLASLRQRLSESKRILDSRGKSGSGHGAGNSLWPGANRDGCDGLIPGGECLSSPNATSPEPLASKVGDTQLTVQTSRDDAQVLAGLFPDTSILTLHNSELEVLPQVAFRLPRQTDKVLLLDKLMIVAYKAEDSATTLQVVSSHHAEIHLESRSREDPILQNFSLSNEERIIGFHKIHFKRPAGSSSSSPDADDDDAKTASQPVTESSSQSGVNAPTTATSSRGMMTDPREDFIAQVQIKVSAAKSRGFHMFEPCLIVSSAGIYVLKLARDPVTTFLDCAIQSDFKTAEHTASTFDLDGRNLLELAADVRLSKRDFPGAIALYRLSGCKHLKAVLKFAHSGNVHELLSYLSTLFKTSSVDLTTTDRIHLSNLMLMCYFQQALTKNSSMDGKAEFVSRVCAFMDENHFFESGLAVRLAAETREWVLLQHLCHTRGLYREMLATICTTFAAILQNGKSPSLSSGGSVIVADLIGKLLPEFTQSERKGLWLCLSNRNNLTSCISLPSLGLETLKILMGVLPVMELSDLEAQAVMCCPSRPDFRPLLRNLLSSTLQPQVMTSSYEFVCKLLNYYVTVQLFLIKKLSNEYFQQQQNVDIEQISDHQSSFSSFDPNLVKLTLSTMPTNSIVDKIHSATNLSAFRLIDAGFSHTLVVRPRSGHLYSFGSSNLGALGHDGPLMTSSAALAQQHSPPKKIDFFAKLNSDETFDEFDKDDSDGSTMAGNKFVHESSHHGATIDILSVSCGRTHSLALTDCGLYAWGSSKFGQLGLGPDKVMSSHPSLVTELCDLVIVAIAAGGYHSAAVDVEGRLWTWGWGVHGQLGLDRIEDEYIPRRVLERELSKDKVVQVAAGYAHTLALTDVGDVWAFGCGLFGQLGNGDNRKQTSPIRLDFRRTLHLEGIDDKMRFISTGYFHNLALSQDGQRLYTWGCNPQIIRLEAQQKRKDRLMTELRDPQTPTGNGSNNNNSDEASNGAEGEESKTAADDIASASYYEEMLHFLPTVVDTSMLDSQIMSVSCGNQHSIILTVNGSIYSFGRNIDGQLGIGSRKEAKTPTLVAAFKEDKICQIACGADYSVAMSETGSLFAWGNNSSGQLGKPPIDVAGKESDKVVMMKGTKRIIRLAHNLQNSCDIPKPVIGLTSGVYSEEVFDASAVSRRFVSGCIKMANAIESFSRLRSIQAVIDQNLSLPERIQQHRMNLHLVLEAYYAHLEGNKTIKKCLISENPQAAAKLVLLRDANILQAFEMTLQAVIKQRPPATLTQRSDQIFDAFIFYLNYDLGNVTTPTSEQSRDDEDFPLPPGEIKQRLLERLIACWQDQKLGFVQLERMLLNHATPAVLQILVQTLFEPNEDHRRRFNVDEDGDPDGDDIAAYPMDMSQIDSSGPSLVDLFTPEFCLKVGDLFIKSFRSEVPPASVNRWLQQQSSRQEHQQHVDENDPALSEM